MTLMRYAVVRGLNCKPEVVAQYLPANYRVLGVAKDEPFPGRVEDVVIIEGRDPEHGGFTLDHYVIPRLGTGLMRADEIDLSSPLMKQIEQN